jgi:hypothetical protein
VKIEAEKAIFDRISERAPVADADELLKLGQTFGAVVYGAQGGQLARVSEETTSSTTDSTYRGESTYVSDTHQTEHPSSEPRRSPGFATPEEEP